MPTEPLLFHIGVNNAHCYPSEERMAYVRANSAKEAIHWLLDNDERFADPRNIDVRQLPSLIDLVAIPITPKKDTLQEKMNDFIEEVIRVTEEPQVIHKPFKGKPAKAKHGGTRVSGEKLPEGEITIAQAMELTGLNKAAVKNRAFNGTFLRGTVRGGINKASVDEWLAKGGLKQSNSKLSEKKLAQLQMMRDRRAANRNAPPPVKKVGLVRAVGTPSDPRTHIPAEDFVQEEKLAKELGMDLARLRMIKREGNIEGGNGWIDRPGIKAYMASPEFEEPLS